MKKINRRLFIRNSSLAAGAAFGLSQVPKIVFGNAPSVDLPIGFQTWSVKDDLAKDFAGTLKKMAGMGYKYAEMCSPKGYETSGFGHLLSMKTSEMRKVINDAGLTCPSCHFGLKELTDHLDDRIEFARELGLEHMVCSSYGLPKTATLNDYLVASDKLNKAGEKIKAAGMQAGFHNHAIEFTKLDGKLIYDEMMKRLDGDLVKMQFQTEVINYGYKASTYFKEYPGRYISAHLSDWTKDKKMVPVGKGVIDWKEFFDAAQAAGVKYHFVEMEPETFKDSANYISSL